MAGAAGFEPTHAGIKTPCLAAWLRPKAVTGTGLKTTGLRPAEDLLPVLLFQNPCDLLKPLCRNNSISRSLKAFL